MAHPHATPYSPAYSSNLSPVHPCVCACVDFVDDLASQYISLCVLSASAYHKPSVSPSLLLFVCLRLIFTFTLSGLFLHWNTAR